MHPTSSSSRQAVPATLTPYRWVALIAGFGALASLLMIWRWGGTIEDSLAYFNTARYLRGELAAAELRAPFPYRLLVPALAAALPGELRNGFAMLNWVFVTAAACVMTLAIQRLGFGTRRALAAGLLLLVSLPTFWYAPYLLVDPGSVFARSVFVLAALTGQPWLAVLAGLVGTAIREENILLLVWLVATRHIALAPGLSALAAAGMWMVTVRWWLIPALPSYSWTPSWWTVNHALRDVPSILSLVGCAGFVLPLALVGMRRAPPVLAPLKSLLVLMVLPPLYAALSVRIDGRVIWGLYPFLIPFAVAAFKRPSATGTSPSA